MSETKGVLELTNNNFNETIEDGVTLVDFWAQWCMPCRMQGPIIDQVAQNIGDKAKIGKLNVDENREIASQYGISSIPSLLIFKNGEIVKQFVGVQDDKTLIGAIESLD